MSEDDFETVDDRAVRPSFEAVKKLSFDKREKMRTYTELEVSGKNAERLRRFQQELRGKSLSSTISILIDEIEKE